MERFGYGDLAEIRSVADSSSARCIIIHRITEIRSHSVYNRNRCSFEYPQAPHRPRWQRCSEIWRRVFDLQVGTVVRGGGLWLRGHVVIRDVELVQEPERNEQVKYSPTRIGSAPTS